MRQAEILRDLHVAGREPVLDMRCMYLRQQRPGDCVEQAGIQSRRGQHLDIAAAATRVLRAELVALGQPQQLARCPCQRLEHIAMAVRFGRVPQGICREGHHREAVLDAGELGDRERQELPVERSLDVHDGRGVCRAGRRRRRFRGVLLDQPGDLGVHDGGALLPHLVGDQRLGEFEVGVLRALRAGWRRTSRSRPASLPPRRAGGRAAWPIPPLPRSGDRRARAGRRRPSPRSRDQTTL